ncbi:MAG TPA: polysaccharide biosynthesis/export family protein [Parvibaculum sp.]
MRTRSPIDFRRLRRAALFVAVSASIAVPALADDVTGSVAPSSQPGASPSTSHAVVNDPNYQLGPGDHVRIIVYGQPDLTGEFQVDGSGKVAFPLVGNIDAGGQSASQLEKTITAKLQPDYLQDPRVSVEIMTYRPFYIVGEVKNPGNYPYTNGMTVINAIAMAGGFTYRARDDEFQITRAKDPTKRVVDANQLTEVHPGDVITVPERWF